MAIILNTSSEIGDVMIIKTETPILGLLYLSSFTDTVIGETASKYFTKVFRYSVDGGITYSDWMNLTNDNIEGIETSPTHAFLVEYRYQRSGTDTSGTLEFDDVTLNGIYEAISDPDVYSNSIFAQFVDFWGLCVLNWSLNVLEKIYRGIVPKYIERGETENVGWADRDFLDFWRSITHFFAIIVCYIRSFENIESNKPLLLEYLRNHDLYVCEETSLVDLIYLMNNLFDEIRQRGTMQIAIKKSEDESEESDSSISDSSLSDSSSSLFTSSSKQVNGELLRLICYQSTDEFIFCPINNIGWILNSSSPLYKGTNFAYNAIKGYELSQNFVDLTKYPINNLSYCSIKSTDKGNSLSIDNIPNGSSIGMKLNSFNNKYGIVVDLGIDYEITFWIKQISVEETLTLACKTFDENGNQVNLQSIITGTNENTFFSEQKLNISDQWYFVRGIIYNKDTSLLTSDQAKLNLGYGQNLRFNNLIDIVYLIPELYIENNTGSISNEVYIWDFKIRPLKYDFGVGFIGLQNLIVTWMKNNSGKYTDDQVTEITRRKLIPYNFALVNNFI